MGLSIKGRKLLLADDSITIQKVVELVLADEGFELKLAGNGEEALEALPAFKPDVVLADLEMPKLGGYELCRRIKSVPETRYIPVILMAGAFETVDEDLIKKAGADDYIIKPFESKDLISKLLKVLPDNTEPPFEAEGFSQALAEASDEGGPDSFAGGKLQESFEEELVSEEFVEEVIVPQVEESSGSDESDAASAGEVFTCSRQEGISGNPGTAPEAETQIPVVSAGEIRDIIRAQVGASIEEALGKIDFVQIVMEAAIQVINGIAQKITSESLPGIVESVMSRAVSAAAADMKKEVERAVWQNVPELAESIIKKEIESIRQGI